MPNEIMDITYKVSKLKKTAHSCPWIKTAHQTIGRAPLYDVGQPLSQELPRARITMSLP